MRVVLLVIFLGFFTSVFAQEKATVYGRITDEYGRPLEFVNVAISGLSGGTTTNGKGRYELEVPAAKSVYLAFSFIGYEKQVEEINLQPGEKIRIDKVMVETLTVLPTYEVQDEKIRTSNLKRIDPKVAVNIPTSSDRIATLIKTQPGVSSSNELSSQYSVRGGNFDENLVYVNDIEIYRPFLVRSGQQEGLSFVNADLVSSLLFSAGGFDAKYGDKMSSVLDLQYKKPTEFGGSFSASLLGGSVHLEGTMGKEEKKIKPFTYLMGVRYKTTQYLLNALETKGDYKPTFIDVQGLFTYRVSEKVEMSFLGNIARNKYKLVPETRETDFGTVQQAQRLTIYFEGQEVDDYLTYLGGFTTTYSPDRFTRLKLIISGYNSLESENYDVLGQYFIGRIENNLGSENFGDVVESQGVGSFLQHARNDLDIKVFNIAHRGTRIAGNNFIQWGVKFQRENIDDRMNEWVMIDSAGYSLPRPADSVGYVDPNAQPYNPFELYEQIVTSAQLQSNRYTGFIQNTWNANVDTAKFTLTAGIRANYWDYNNQLVVSPRATVSFKPDWERDILFRFSAGLYYQPPFYRELKDLDGTINSDQKAQKSYHFVAASDLNFEAWDRPFKFVTEVYYKYLANLVPYLVDNVRIRYYSFDQSVGYSTGIDFKVNGEFVKGVESWASLSFLSTKEDIKGDYYINSEGNKIEPGYIPRPTDQHVQFSILFQDYLPMNPTYKMSLTLLFGSSLPFGPPNSPKYQHTLRMPPYRRVDIGFSKELIGTHSRFNASSPFRFFKTMWVTAEVLNLLQVNNTVSYIWVTDIYGRQYAVPNYLTPRQLNIKLVAEF
ncbi:MAG TPA: carboxypeptidase-like regulatory domain-containing protein [Bacteroidales bacterium]|nr:carboxypeptidase-like regulatory domain-containing protein [Bacteroidales bacterium]HRX97002.1 carboxypeptidase-like regulatory domain-containing protein [Bacteroidales bacterium]